MKASDITVVRLGGIYYKIEKNASLTKLDPAWGEPPKGVTKMKYPEKNASLFYIGEMHFALDVDWRLWSLCAHEWRPSGTDAWKEGHCGCFLSLEEDVYEIRRGDSVYRVDKDGYERVIEKSLDEMLKEIAARVDLIEYKVGEGVFALLSDKSVDIGCSDLKKVLEQNGMITAIHSTNERTLYRLNKEKVAVVPFFVQNVGIVRKVHKDLVTP